MVNIFLLVYCIFFSYSHMHLLLNSLSHALLTATLLLYVGVVGVSVSEAL